jgi:hypothetical protein
MVISTGTTPLEIAEARGNTPLLRTTSRAAGDVMRTWISLDEFIEEVANARIYDGVHIGIQRKLELRWESRLAG